MWEQKQQSQQQLSGITRIITHWERERSIWWWWRERVASYLPEGYPRSASICRVQRGLARGPGWTSIRALGTEATSNALTNFYPERELSCLCGHSESCCSSVSAVPLLLDSKSHRVRPRKGNKTPNPPRACATLDSSHLGCPLLPFYAGPPGSPLPYLSKSPLLFGCWKPFWRSTTCLLF